MLNNFKIVNVLVALLIVFCLLQMGTVAVFFPILSSDRENFSDQQDISNQRTELTGAWAYLLRTRLQSNRAILSYLLEDGSTAEGRKEFNEQLAAAIEDSEEKVSMGSGLVTHAGETMSEIVDAVTHVTNIMSEIASASDEQSRGIVQVGVAVTEMDQVTQQNASLVEESASAATLLEAQACHLTEVVAMFRIKPDSDTAVN
ncbi:hypothetical protein CBW53_04075 [Yersinia frederiksenii]|nr:hypothetical protein CBW53_04075 [Yersinia frederiksenii]CNI45116.1 methyl-accepting chemotaxis protein [Yersinia frederiksenii]